MKNIKVIAAERVGNDAPSWRFTFSDGSHTTILQASDATLSQLIDQAQKRLAALTFAQENL